MLVRTRPRNLLGIGPGFGWCARSVAVEAALEDGHGRTFIVARVEQILPALEAHSHAGQA